MGVSALTVYPTEFVVNDYYQPDFLFNLVICPADLAAADLQIPPGALVLRETKPATSSAEFAIFTVCPQNLRNNPKNILTLTVEASSLG